MWVGIDRGYVGHRRRSTPYWTLFGFGVPRGCVRFELWGKTLKFEGTISGIPIVVLVDSGASHNFISRKLVNALGLSSQCFSGINIKLGDGHKVFVTEKCVQFHIWIGDCEFTLDALLFDMDHLDLVLGMEWLNTLGDVIHNWKQHSMQFMWNGKPIKIQGLSRIPPSLQTWLSLGINAIKSKG